MRDVAATCRALRVWRHGKPRHIRFVAITVIYNLITIARGSKTPQLYAALADNIKRMRA